jgi:hypothetical protein
MKPTLTPATTTNPNEPIIPATDLSVDSPLSGILDNLQLSEYISTDTLLYYLNILWSLYALLAYILCIIMLILYVYASTRYKQLSELRTESIRERERIYDERFRTGPKNDRLADVMTHIASEHPNDWKLAIIEADIILDEALKKAGYGGVSLGERLKSISPAQLKSLDAAWQAHKVRNQIAHEGADFVLTRRLADETIKQYKMVFNELGVG